MAALRVSREVGSRLAGLARGLAGAQQQPVPAAALHTAPAAALSKAAPPHAAFPEYSYTGGSDRGGRSGGHWKGRGSQSRGGGGGGGYGNRGGGDWGNSRGGDGYGNRGGNRGGRNWGNSRGGRGGNWARQSKEPAMKPTIKLTPTTATPADMLTFDSLKERVSQRALAVLEKQGVEELTDIQALAYEPILRGDNVIGRSRTGTGKTLAFCLPLVERVAKERPAGGRPRGRAPLALIVTPTRELASQVGQELAKISRGVLITSTFTGGTSYGPQAEVLRSGVDILVGTPGRLRDHMDQERLKLSGLRTLVLDEADQMLDMGFKSEIEELIAAAGKRGGGDVDADGGTPKANLQFLLFSATAPPWIRALCDSHMPDGFTMIDTVDSNQRTALTVTHTASVIDRGVRDEDAIKMAVEQYAGQGERVLIFAERKREVDELASALGRSCCSLHGDMQQAARSRALEAFRSKQRNILVATDVAARGLDIANVELVIQVGVPDSDDTYVHRSGRTGRAGKSGHNVVLCHPSQMSRLRMYSRSLGFDINMGKVDHVAVQARRVDRLRAELPKGRAPADTRALAEGLLQEGDEPIDLAAKLLSLRLAGN